MLYTHLERHVPAKRMARYHALRIERNLFGGYSLIREWGRVGQHGGHMRIDLHDSEREAQVAFETKLREKQRRGYK